MVCQNCGREMKNGARFCIGCGAQHDENGQLVNNNSNNKLDYNKTMMASNMQQSNGNVDYDRTMMTGSTGFKQYQPEQSSQNYQQSNYSNYTNDSFSKNAKNKKAVAKKGISPILIICPIIIVGALAFSIFGDKILISNKVKSSTKEETTIEEVVEKKSVSESITETETVSEVEQKIHLNGYWSADAEYFYENGEMQKNKWVEDYYVGDDGRKVVNTWVDNKHYVDATGKMARNEWIEFTYYGEDGQKKIGYYYVDSDGFRVTNKTIDGRYLNDEGCYFPTIGEVIDNNVKKNSEIKEISVGSVVESTSIPQISIQPEIITTVPTAIIPQNPIIVPTEMPFMTQAPISEYPQVIIPPEVNIVSGNGEIIGYQIVTEAFPEKKITKFDTVIVTDTNYMKLANSINEWNVNRDRSGLAQGEALLVNNITINNIIKVGRNDKKVFSLCETKSKLDNNKVYDRVKEGKTWDSNTGELLTIEDICYDEEKYLELAKKVISKLKAYKSSIDEEVYDGLIEGDSEDVFEFCTWYMTEKGIEFIFNKEQIISEKLDGVSFILTYEESGGNVNKLLKKKYRK